MIGCKGHMYFFVFKSLESSCWMEAIFFEKKFLSGEGFKWDKNGTTCILRLFSIYFISYNLLNKKKWN